MHTIAVLGCTGSIGRQALDVASLHEDQIKITALTAHHNAELLFEQVRTFKPAIAALTGEEVKIPKDLKFCQWFFGPDALEKVAMQCEAEAVLVSVMGMVGLSAVMAARKSGKKVLLANKEALVAGGQLVMDACPDINGEKTLLPIDSEHSAIFQCLRGAEGNPIDEILLTASGGPFRTWKKEDIENASVEQALGHPTWSMGQKITIDSASMFNKGLEIIEARWLFDVPQEKIHVLVHPQSIVHSAVCYKDGAVIAQMGTPDMRLPILYAMLYPNRLPTGGKKLDLAKISSLTFEEADTKKFPSILLARQSLDAKGIMSCVLNAANEEAAGAFLNRKIRFGNIYRIVENVMNRTENKKIACVEDVLEADRKARSMAQEEIKSLI